MHRHGVVPVAFERHLRAGTKRLYQRRADQGGGSGDYLGQALDYPVSIVSTRPGQWPTYSCAPDGGSEIVLAVGRHSAAELEQEPDVRRRLPWFLREPGPLALIAIVVIVIVCGAWALIDIGRDEGPAETVAGGGTPTAAYVPTAPLEVPPSDASPSGSAPPGATPSQAGTPSPAADGVVGSPVGAPTTRQAAGPVPTTAARPRPTTTRPTPTVPGTKPATATIAGTYSLDVVWRGRFQASVVLHNGTASQQTWTVLLSYGSGITANVAAWVDGAPSPKVSRTGNSWAFTAGAPLAAGGNQTLRVQFDISDQKAPASVSCAVNGRACVMS